MAVIYTDGSCLVNPGGAAGWAFCILDNKSLTVGSDGYAPKKINTNNRMELMAIVEALKRLPRHRSCHIYTDSQWALKGATGQQRRHKNLDLWDMYDEVSQGKAVEFSWVKGHRGNVMNEFVDKLAREEARRCENEKLNIDTS